MFHSKARVGSFWEVDLGDAGASLDSITIHNRKEAYGRANISVRLHSKVLDADDNVLHTAPLSNATKPDHTTPFAPSVRLHQLLKKSPVSPLTCATFASRPRGSG